MVRFHSVTRERAQHIKKKKKKHLAIYKSEVRVNI